MANELNSRHRVHCYLNDFGFSVGLINHQGMVVNGQVWVKPSQIDRRNPSLQLLRNNQVGAAVIDRDEVSLADFGLGHGGCDIAIILNTKNESVATPIWEQGLPTKEVDRFLSQSARLATVVFVENSDGVQLCQQADPKKLFALFVNDIKEAEELIDLGVNYIKLLKQEEGSILVCICYKHKNYEKWLDIGKGNKPLPWLTLLATLLVMGIDIGGVGAANVVK